MAIFKIIFMHFRKQRYFYAIFLVAVLAAFWYWHLRKNGPAIETLVIEPATFWEQTLVSGTTKAAENVDLSFSQGGRITGTYAIVGDTIPAGKVLATTENSDLAAQVRTAEARLAALQAGTRPEEIAVTQSHIKSDTIALGLADQTLTNALADAYTTSDTAVHNTIDVFFSNPRTNPQLSLYISDPQLKTSLESERFSVENMLTSWQKEIPKDTKDTKDTSGTAVVNLSSMVAATQTNLAIIATLLFDSNAALNRAITSPSISQATINQWVIDTAAARTAINAAVSVITSADAAEKNAAAALDHDQKNLALEQAGSTVHDIAAAQAEVDLARAELAKTRIVAPFAGTVTAVYAKTGEVAAPAAPEVSLMSRGLFEIESFIPEVQIAAIAVGDNATTTLDAYGTGTPFAAKIIAIDPGKTVHNGVATYKTTLQFLAPDPRIRSGMTASLAITTGKKPDAIIVPQGAVIDKNGETYVEITIGDKTTDVPVTIDTTSALGEVEVLSGLKRGDTIVLNPIQP